jgi:hypothetical protein
MIEKTTVSRSEPSDITLWLPSTPSCFTPRRAIAARDCWFIQWVRSFTAARRTGSVASSPIPATIAGGRSVSRQFRPDLDARTPPAVG